MAAAQTDDLTPQQWELVAAIEQHRIQAIEKVAGSVIAIYGENREGGGSGVVIDPSGIALTNHHVIMGAGVSGWGGLADGNLYHWKLIGTDPGGDVSIIQLEGAERFPYTWLGNSDNVKPGDWALAMGNPFVLTEDQFPTVTLGIVSGVKRYQPGAGANQLVYGNCIQVDSSINPGNSGGPLFNLNGRVIGINGRGSFKDRGRVNVGLGYAISANQIKNFIPDLLATKLVEHGTLDANFSDRQGKVVCSTINRDSAAAKAGLKLGDELLEFEGEAISSANQFTNLICTLPADWPASLKVRKPDQTILSLNVRLLGLPYPKPQAQPRPAPGPDQPEEEDEQIEQQQAMIKLLSSPAGKVRDFKINRSNAHHVIDHWLIMNDTENPELTANEQLAETGLKLEDDLIISDEVVGSQTLWVATTGQFRIEWRLRETVTDYWSDGKAVYIKEGSAETQKLSAVDAKLALPVVQAMGILAPNTRAPFQFFGQVAIDGSDKAQGRPCYRMLQTDSDLDRFYFWLSVETPTGGPQHHLLKASAEKDCQDVGGVLFSDWKVIENDSGANGLRLIFPRHRSFILGLGEDEFLKIKNRKTVSLTEIDAKLFSPTAGE